MSDHPDHENVGGSPLDEAPTEAHQPVTHTLATPLDGPGWPADDESADSDEEWVSQTTHGIRLPLPAAALLAVVLIAGGFWGGAALEKGQGGGSTTLAGVAARFRAAAGAGATGASGSTASRFGGFASTSAATGTISVVSGDTLYVDDTLTGSIVKVTLTRSTTITRNADAAKTDLRPGDTVTVQGATGSSGTVTATSVSATAPGVSSGFGGFGRGLGTTGVTGGTGSTATTTPALFGG